MTAKTRVCSINLSKASVFKTHLFEEHFCFKRKVYMRIRFALLNMQTQDVHDLMLAVIETSKKVII